MLWYKYTLPNLLCLGLDVDCKRASNCSTNYYLCDHCRQRQWFVSKIMTFKSDAITRAESQRRLNATFEIPIHRELKKQQKEFCKRGGTIKLIFIELEQPTICWDKSGKTITSVKWNHN